MAVVQADTELGSRQSLHDDTFSTDFIFFFRHTTSFYYFLFTILGEIAPFDSADRFLLLHAALFALGNEPAFAANSAQHSTLDHFLAKALEQGVLGLAIS
jgi:hypothetical protein